jgi:hypothetical protein
MPTSPAVKPQLHKYSAIRICLCCNPASGPTFVDLIRPSLCTYNKYLVPASKSRTTHADLFQVLRCLTKLLFSSIPSSCLQTSARYQNPARTPFASLITVNREDQKPKALGSANGSEPRGGASIQCRPVAACSATEVTNSGWGSWGVSSRSGVEGLGFSLCLWVGERLC